jgi:hypothetical protein
MKKLLRAAVTCLALLAVPSAAEADAVSVSPTGDAFVNTANPTTNQGGQAYLRVTSAKTAFLSFDVDLPVGAHDATATLCLTVTRPAAVPTDVHVAESGPFDQAAVTAATAPAVGAELATFTVSVAGQVCTTGLPFTGGQVAFAVSSSSPYMNLPEFASSEALAGQPSLQVDFTAGVPPSVSDPAAVSGDASVGATLTAAATFAGDDPLSVTYQWEQCSDASCADVVGATAPTYNVTLADVGYSLRAKVMAENSMGSAESDAGTSVVSAPPPPRPVYDVDLTNEMWHCKTPQDHTRIRVTISSLSTRLDAVHLDAGCTGVIDEITISTDNSDGIKVHDVHDLVIAGGSITCTARSVDGVHQDGIQAMGGDHVTFQDYTVFCPTSNNGALFTSAGNGTTDQADAPSYISCVRCDLYGRNNAVHVGVSNHTSVTDSILHLGHSDSAPADCVRVLNGADERGLFAVDAQVEPLADHGNVCLDDVDRTLYP